MQLTMLLTADYASADQATGKLNILGAFTRIIATRFPAKHPRMALVAQVRPDLGDHSEPRTFTIMLTDEDGTDLMRISGPFQLPHGEGGIRPDFNAIVELNGLEFPKRGTYQFTVVVNDEALGSTSIELLEKQPSE